MTCYHLEWCPENCEDSKNKKNCYRCGHEAEPALKILRACEGMLLEDAISAIENKKLTLMLKGECCSRDSLISKIRVFIHSEFPLLRVSYYKKGKNLSVEVNSEIYHSNKYMELVTRINTEYLWPNKIHNVLFVSRD